MKLAKYLNRLTLKNRRRQRTSQVAPLARLEQLETKQLLSGSALFLPATGELSIEINNTDSVIVRSANGLVVIETVNGGMTTTLTSLGDVPAASVQKIVVLGSDEPNRIDLSLVTAADFTMLGNMPMDGTLTNILVDGANGDDVLIGSPDFADSLIGGHGNDTLQGDGGIDTLVGGDGADSISGGTGADSITGGDGNDSINGDDGDDLIASGNGQDTVSGGNDNDSIGGANGNDVLSGNTGDDTLNGDGGNDTISGDDGNDLIFGGDLNDSLLGGADNDTLNGQSGNDSIDGEAGDDSVVGGAGHDSLIGQAGNDVLNGGAGNDTAVGNDGDDNILGGAGSDRLLGDGADEASQQSGNDSINGQAGDDTLIGGGGQDTLNGGDGTDTVQSSFVASGPPAVPTAPTQPAFPPPTTTSQFAQFDPAVASGTSNALGNTATLTIGSGDNSLSVQTNGSGLITTATFDPLGPAGPFDPYFGLDFLQFSIDNMPLQTLFGFGGGAMTGSATDATSSFSQAGLNFTLIQQIEPLLSFTLSTIGGLVTQTYSVTNTTGAAITLDFVRNTHYHNPGTSTGGGRIVGAGGTEILLNPDNLGGINTSNTYVGITSFSGQPVPTNRFEVASSPSPSPNPVFTDAVFGDTDADGFSDTLAHTGLGLRSVYSVPAGGTIVYTQHTLFGVSAPIDIADAPTAPPNVPPVAMSDAAVGGSSFPVTLDVVSNDTDANGVVDFSSVQIATAPTNGTAVSLGNGLITYTPNPGFFGADTFTYTVADNDGALSAPGTVTINVLLADVIGDLLVGGNDGDVIVGNSGNDTINAGGGNDSILGSGGDDLIAGGAGDDTLDGQAGNDTLDGQGGDDLLRGGDGDDTFVLGALAGGQDSVDGGDGLNSIVANGTGNADTLSVGQVSNLLVVTRGLATITATTLVQSVTVNGLFGNDTITVGNLSGVVPTVLTINGGDGDDGLFANGANIDRVRLFLNGEAGNDSLVGSSGNDRINGGVGNDLANGGAGNDSITGQAGNDILAGGLGNDTVTGGDGTDFVTGQEGDDSLDGGAANDTIRGHEGNDTLQGQAGDDLINGMEGDDSILGGSGQDSIAGGAGGDTIDGGRNDDSINGNSGNDRIRGDHGNDYIDAGTESDTVNGGDGHDTIIATDSNDLLNGGDGNDQINAGGGNDTITGGDGNDSIQGGGGNDVILGGDGDDAINGQGGTDTIAGNQGVDVISDPANEINELFVLSAELMTALLAG